MAEEVLDAPSEELDLTDDSSTGVEDSRSDTADAGAGEVVDNADTPQEGEVGNLRGTELYRAVKDKLKNGEKLSPQEIRSLRNAIHIAGKADQATGGDLGRFESERAAYAQLADGEGQTPEQVVEDTLAERHFWRDFDSRWEKGDASLVKQMVDSNPESFQAIAPAVFDEYARLNPEAFSSYVAKSAVSYLVSQQIPVQFAIIDTFASAIPDFVGKQRLLEAIEGIKTTLGSLDTMAAKPLPQKAASSTQTTGSSDDGRAQSLETREMNIRRYEWNTEAAPKGRQLRDTEMNRIAQGQKVTLSDADKSKITAAVKEEVDARLAANTKYGEAMRGFLQNGNRRSYVERAHSEYQKIVASITRRHTQALIDEKKAAAKAKPAATQSNSNGRPQAQHQNNGNGEKLQWLNGSPGKLGLPVDYLRTSHSMLARNRAYLKGRSGIFAWKQPAA